jgi:hypothetical protein
LFDASCHSVPGGRSGKDGSQQTDAKTRALELHASEVAQVAIKSRGNPLQTKRNQVGRENRAPNLAFAIR